MLHYIIVKWNAEVSDKLATLENVKSLYANATDIEGVRAVDIRENITPRDNRYDVMIALDIEDDKLTVWDNSELHKKWKADFGPLIEKKAIFDSRN